MEDAVDVKAIKHIMQTLFSLQKALQDLAPEYNWAGLGNLLGDYGEFLAVKIYNLEKAPRGSAGYDALNDKVTINLKFINGSFGSIHYLSNGSKQFPKERLEVF